MGIRKRFSIDWIIALTGLLVINLVILATEFSTLRLGAGLVFLFVLPGWVWIETVNWGKSRDAIEYLVLIPGLSTVVSAVAILGAVYWPGPLTLPVVLVWLNAATLLGVVARLIFPSENAQRNLVWPDKKVWLILLAIIGVAAYLRFTTLGYGEFHEDELENMRLAVRAMKGEEYAPFLDSKGPVHWFFPAALWLITGWVNELIVRLPFAICSTFTVVAVFMWGRRMVNNSVGLIAALVVALNGFFIAFSRHVENPSLIVFWGVLAAWCAYRYYRSQSPSALVLGSFFLAVGLVAHPDVLFYLPPFGLIVLHTLWAHRRDWTRHWRPLLAAAILFAVLVSVFYVPYLLDPSLQYTVEYLTGERIGTRLLYNSLLEMLDFDSLYSTWYYAPWLILFSGAALAGQLYRHKKPGVLIAIFFAGAMLSTVVVPQLWEWGAINGAFLPYALLLLVLLALPRVSAEVKMLALWFGVPFLGLEFLAQSAAMHIQDAYPAWSLLAAIGFYQYWVGLKTLRYGQTLKIGTTVVLVVVLSLILFYQSLEYLFPVATYRLQEIDAKFNENSIYRKLYGELPRPRKLVSNPRLGGWKVVGALYDQGILAGDFRSVDESFAVPIWYTHQTPRSCYTDPQNYFVSLKGRETPEEVEKLPQQGYGLTRIVQIDDGTPMLYLYEKGKPSSPEPEIYHIDDYRALFDTSATPERYTEEYAGENRVHLNFGQKLLLTGYTVDSQSLKPGETMEVDLYWQALSPMDIRYRAFVHVETDQMWGQHDEDPACRLRTDEWRAPQSAVGQFRVTLDSNTPPGDYPITIGVYNPETWERLEIFDEAGQNLGSVLNLDTIRVE